MLAIMRCEKFDDLAIASRSKLGEAGEALFQYWSSLPRPGHVPDREDFNPLQLRRLLPIVSLVEHMEPGVWRIRLIGTEIRSRSGRDLTGLNFLDLLDPAGRAATARRIGAMISHPCGSWSIRLQRRRSGLEYCVRAVSLPLRDREGRVRLVIVTNEEIGPGVAIGPRVSAACSDDQMTLMSHSASGWIDIGAGVPPSI